jgi:predicted NUDIX family phosphoesterase
MSDILCIHANDFWRYGGCEGFAFDGDPGHPDLATMLGASRWLPRTAGLEHDAKWLQWIPYGVLTWEREVFAYRRTKAGAEGRLRGRLSLGVGGHVERRDVYPGDGDPAGMKTLATCLAREVAEEARPRLGWTSLYGGLLYWPHDASNVGRHHVGAVFVVASGGTEVRPGAEVETKGLGWTVPTRLQALGLGEHGPWEPWSAVLIPHLIRLLMPAPVAIATAPV